MFPGIYLQRKSSSCPVKTQWNKCDLRLVVLLRLALILLWLGEVCHYKEGREKIKWAAVTRRTTATPATEVPPARAAPLRPSHVTSR